MKFIHCPRCKDVFLPIERKTRTCACGRHGAKYLADNITTVVTEGALIFGIDNVSFINARQRTEYFQDHEDYKDMRIDSFFTGWIPTLPGEIIFLPTVYKVRRFDYYNRYTHISTNPSTYINE